MKNNIIYRGLRKIYHKLLKNKNENKYKNIKDKLIKKLKKYEVISFDIFDTLITRTLYSPDDLFMIMGEKLNDKNFIGKRKEAERCANINLKKDVNLDDIYNEYQKINKISKKETKKIKELEISLELLFIVPRIDMLDVLKELKKLNKKVILTSDMYLNENIIIQMLEKCNYTNKLYDDFYLSNKINKRKDRKDIWPFLKEQYKNKKIIHVGDNEKSDFIYPKQFSIDSVKIKSSKELLEESLIYENLKFFIENRSTSDSIYLGLIVNKKIFNSPFSNLQINDLDDFGYVFHAPILNSFLKNVNSIKEDCILFLAREGYYFQKLYKEYTKLYNLNEKENYYFLTSRKATSTAILDSDVDILKLTDKEFVGTIKDFFSQILEIEYNDNNFDIVLPDDSEKVKVIMKKYIIQIKNNIKDEKENYLTYINNTIKNFNKKSIAIVDLGYSGTIQYNLSKLTNKQYVGYYLTNSESVKKYNKNSQLNFLYDINNNEEYKKIYYYSLILEYFLSAPYGQLQKFKKIKKEIKPIYNNEQLDDNKVKALDIIYDSVLDYMKDIYEISKLVTFEYNKDLICRMYILFVESGIISKTVKDKFDFIDSFNASGIRNVFKIISRY